MRKWRIAAICLCLAVVLTACLPYPDGSGPGSQNPGAIGTPDKPQVEPKLPALPLWSPTGLTLVGESRQDSLSYTYAPVTIQDEELQPVRIPGGVLYLRLQDGEVWLHGTGSGRGGYAPLGEPRRLYRLPLKAGDTWEITYPGDLGSTYAYRVEAVEAVVTPGGERLAARLLVQREGQPLRTEWWAPGYGLVRTRDITGGEFIALREVRENARDAEAVGRPAPGLKVILWDDGQVFRATTVDGARELFRADDAYWRSSYRWAKSGGNDLLWNTHVPGSWGLRIYSARAYSPSSGRLEAVHWVSSAGEKESVLGSGDWSEDGAFRLNDETGYPVRWYVYRYDGKLLRAEPADDQVIRAGSAEAFVRRLSDVPPLREQDFVAMFESKAEGQMAWAMLRAAAWTPIGGPRVTALGHGIYEVHDGQVRFRVTVVEGQQDLQLRDFFLIK